MAIKGKRRSRGGRASVGAAPRPQFVVPRKPLFQRTGVRVFLILILLAGLITGIVVGLRVRNTNRKLDAARQDVKEFQVRVETALTAKGIGQKQSTSVVILQELGQTLSELQGGQIKKKKETHTKLDTWNTDAKEAAQTIAALDVGATEYVEDLTEVRSLFQQSLLLYAGLAKSVGVALDVDGEPRKTLIEGILEQYPTAATVFDAGWRQLRSIRQELEIPEPVTPPPGLTPPGGVPGGVPGVPPGLPPGGVPGLPADIPTP